MKIGRGGSAQVCCGLMIIVLFQVQEHLEKGVETRENLSFNEWICDTLGQVVLVVAQAEFSSGTLGSRFSSP